MISPMKLPGIPNDIAYEIAWQLMRMITMVCHYNLWQILPQFYDKKCSHQSVRTRGGVLVSGERERGSKILNIQTDYLLQRDVAQIPGSAQRGVSELS